MTRSRTTDGVLLVDKPAGTTSHDIVAVARRALGIRRIGHAGTLDPFATGLLVLLTGRATRLIPYMDGEPKVYDATVAFGTETSTDDLTGEAVRDAPLPSPEQVESALETLTGNIEQLPPDFSAKQVGGVRAYRAARRGKPLALSPVPVVVHRWEVVERTAGSLRAVVTCSGGTYVRALARDLGRNSGSAAHLESLRRLASGPFRVENAASLDDLTSDDPSTSLQPMTSAIPSMPVQQLEDADLQRILHGIAISPALEANRVALVDSVGELIAVAEREGDQLRPRAVFGDA